MVDHWWWSGSQASIHLQESANSPEFPKSTLFPFCFSWIWIWWKKHFHSVLRQRWSGFANFIFTLGGIGQILIPTLVLVGGNCCYWKMLVATNCQCCSLPLFHPWIYDQFWLHLRSIFNAVFPPIFHLWMTSSGGWSQVAFATCKGFLLQSLKFPE